MTATSEVWWSYNLGPAGDRPRAEVIRELKAFAATNPEGILLQEAIGHRLPRLPGYRLTRSTTIPGRANLAAYTRGRTTRARWIDLDRKWERTEHPGMHPARSILVLRNRRRWGKRRVIVLHAPPTAPDAGPARAEHTKAVTAALEAAPGEVLAAGDFNAVGDSPHSAASIARAVDGQVLHGNHIDAAITKGLRATCSYVDRVGGVQLGSDHPGALRIVLSSKKEKP